MTQATAQRHKASPAKLTGERATSAGRRRHVGVFVAVGALVAVVVALLALNLDRSGARKLTLQPRIGDFTLVTDGNGKPLQQDVAQSLGKAFAAKHSSGVIAGVYADGASATEGVIIVGGPKGDFSSAAQQVKHYAQAQFAAAEAAGVETFPLTKTVSLPVGRFGGSVACTSSEASDQGVPYSVCAWVDSGTEGYALSNDLSPLQLGSTLASLRNGFES